MRAKRLCRNYHLCHLCHSVQAKRDEEPAPFLTRALQGIRGNPVLLKLVPGMRRDDVWMPA
jgi:hypothetical protein